MTNTARVRNTVKPGQYDRWPTEFTTVEVGKREQVSYGDGYRYDVYADGNYVGYVESAKIDSYYSNGGSRIRGTYQGSPTRWAGNPSSGLRSGGWIYHTRGEAIGHVLGCAVSR